MNKEVLQSYLFEAGAKFTAVDRVKDGTFGPGSLGFISYVKSLDDNYQNLAKVVVVITRRGKGGKGRLGVHTLYLPVFVFENENFAKLMPDSNRKYYIHIERETDPIMSIADMDALDFLGWATAMVIKLKKMSESCRHKKWPEDKSNPLNRINRLYQHFEEDPDGHLVEYDNEDFRDNFIAECRRMNSAMARIHLQFDLKKVELELNAAEFLEYTNKGEFIPEDAEDKKNEYEFTDDDKLLTRSVKHYGSIKDEIQKLYDDKQTKKKKKPSEE
jgi:hypothetical protein